MLLMSGKIKNVFINPYLMLGFSKREKNKKEKKMKRIECRKQNETK